MRLGAISRDGMILDDSPTGDTINRAWNLTNHLLSFTSPTPSVIPGDGRSVEFVWKKRGWHIEIEVSPEGDFVWAKQRESGETVSGRLQEVKELLLDLLRNISQ